MRTQRPLADFAREMLGARRVPGSVRGRAACRAHLPPRACVVGLPRHGSRFAASKTGRWRVRRPRAPACLRCPRASPSRRRCAAPQSPSVREGSKDHPTARAPDRLPESETSPSAPLARPRPHHLAEDRRPEALRIPLGCSSWPKRSRPPRPSPNPARMRPAARPGSKRQCHRRPGARPPRHGARRLERNEDLGGRDGVARSPARRSTDIWTFRAKLFLVWSWEDDANHYPFPDT